MIGPAVPWRWCLFFSFRSRRPPDDDVFSPDSSLSSALSSTLACEPPGDGRPSMCPLSFSFLIFPSAVSALEGVEPGGVVVCRCWWWW